ncbi:MAG: hypothetical protein JSS74_17075 [Actinobacteria bacterium]|nr:hypothetical protein [Actinomycetota bacterium]
MRERIRGWVASGQRRLPRLLLGTGVALLLLGLAIGWAIPRPPDVGLALRAGESVRLDAVLKDQNYDTGSVALLDRLDDVLLWAGTKSEGAVRCLVLDQPTHPRVTNCAGREQLAQETLSVTSTEVDSPVPGQRGTQQTQFSGIVLVSPRGYPVGSLRKYTFSSDGPMSMSAEDRAASERISGEQELQYIQIAGRWRGLTIWQGMSRDGEQCLVIDDGATHAECAEQQVTFPGVAPEEKPLLTIDLPARDQRPSARAEMWAPMYTGPYLVITEGVTARSLIPTAPPGD